MIAEKSKALPYVLLTLLIVVVLELGGIGGWLLYDLMRFREQWKTELDGARTLAEQQRAEDKKEAQRAANGTLVEMARTTSSCYADNSVATCYLTNLSDEVVDVCMRGVVVQKESANVGIQSIPMCAGPIRPRETKAVSAPWKGARPVSICKDARGFLEWDNCNFDVVDHEVATAGN